ncbi:hypothetical protein CAPTEDRAFT_187099 [Capitella teleta]|uniref:Sodium/solute symporter n=1 Tax=Capitella teleta TaxID=283909 RepID=R7VIT0_CAPTE|nr:hypothetical protein CAPTEDRAFT_187099 [Capitella teleta]|eukprot:ELU15625.1 hypothetical protein CAPTEDRAFT_187099 [Capitella teleta]
MASFRVTPELFSLFCGVRFYFGIFNAANLISPCLSVQFVVSLLREHSYYAIFLAIVQHRFQRHISFFTTRVSRSTSFTITQVDAENAHEGMVERRPRPLRRVAATGHVTRVSRLCRTVALSTICMIKALKHVFKLHKLYNSKNTTKMLSPVDCIVLALLLCSSLAIGIYQSLTGGKQRTRAEFVLNNRQLKVIPTVISYTVSYQSAIAVLGAPAEYYQWGIPYLLAGDFFMALGMILFERLALPTFYNLGVMSIYEYFELRYGNSIVKRMMSFLGVLKAVLYMSVNVLGPSIALETMTGLPLEAAIFLMAACCAIYTSLGGLRAVIWTDVIQCLVMVLGLIVFLIYASAEVGGIGDVIRIGKYYDRLKYAEFTPSLRTRITALHSLTTFAPLGYMVYGVDQAAYQRYASLPSLSKSRLVLWLMVPCNLMYGALCYAVGASVFAYFANQGCDPLQSGEISRANQVLPYFVKTFFENRLGGKGLFLAVLYGASLSSISSILSGCAANTWEDHLKGLFPRMSELRAAIANRVLVMFFALLASAIAIACASVQSNLVQMLMTLNSGIAGPALGVFLLASTNKRSEWRGAIIGCLVGIGFTCWIAFNALNLAPVVSELETIGIDQCMHNITVVPNTVPAPEYSGFNKIYAISFLWYFPIGCLTTMIIGGISSELFKFFGSQKPFTVQDKYVISYKDALTFGGNRSRVEPENPAMQEMVDGEELEKLAQEDIGMINKDKEELESK